MNGVVSVQLADAGSLTDHVIVASFIVNAPFRVKVSTGGVISLLYQVYEKDGAEFLDLSRAFTSIVTFPSGKKSSTPTFVTDGKLGL